MAIGNRTLFALALAALMLNMGGWDKVALSLAHEMTRSFFGIYSVRTMDGEALMLVHGTTTHGIENLGSPARERMQTSYYAPRSGVGLAMRALPGIFPHARVGLVGLGAGTLACASTTSRGAFTRSIPRSRRLRALASAFSPAVSPLRLSSSAMPG